MNLFKKTQLLFATIALLFIPFQLFAAEMGGGHDPMDLSSSPVGYIVLILFIAAYIFVMAEEFTHLRKSKPVILAAGIIWAMIGWVYFDHGMSELAEHAVRHNLLEYAELMLFLLVAMTYINGMEERRVFDALRSWLIRKGFSFRQLCLVDWYTGILYFPGRR